MTDLTLVLGSKRLSSWSLRPWLFLQHHGVNFREIVIELDQPSTREKILKYSPSGRVPVLLSSEFAVWDSLAICEFAAEYLCLPGAWPMAPAARAMARAVAAEMHSGFANLRRELPFDAARRKLPAIMGEATKAELARVRQLWRTARTRYGSGGPWLFGHFGIVDAMYAPVAMRLRQYGVDVDGPERDYYLAVNEHHAVEAWVESVIFSLPNQPASAVPKAEKSELEKAHIAASQKASGIKSVILPP